MANYRAVETFVARRVAGVAIIGVWLFMGCAPELMPAATAKVAPTSATTESTVYAGVKRVDITPPPGVATFGHGPDAHVAAGYWTRLYCRAFVFVAEPGGQPTAFVSCELAAVSMLLQRTVVMRLRKSGIEIPPQRLFITAIHTHAGPAHYFDASSYGGVASTQAPGFDPRVLDYLADRIAGAVGGAYQSAIQARTARRVTWLRWAHGKSWGLTHNRSLEAYTRNNPPMDPGAPADLSSLDAASLAIDPNMDVLELSETAKNGKRMPLGWIAFYAMHPTVLSNKNRVIGSDVFGVASRLVEQELRRFVAEQGEPDREPWAAIVNTNEGDMAPRWSTGDRDEAIALGRRLAEELLRVYKESSAPPQDKTIFASGYLEVNLPNNGFGLPPGKRLCKKPELGVNAPWGAQDHPTGLASLRELTSPPRGDSYPPLPRETYHETCQYPKTPAFGWFQNLMEGSGAFPSTIALGLSRIGDTWIAFVPAELTVTAGWHIRQAIVGVKPSPLTHARIGGLTNGYMEYIATKDEYQVQRYEGASTLYGPMMAPFLTAVFTSMTQKMLAHDGSLPTGTGFDVATEFPYETGPERHRLADSVADSVKVKAIDLCMLKPRIAGRPPRLCFVWQDGPPNAYASPPRRPVALVKVDTDWKRLQWRVFLSGLVADPSTPDPLFARRNNLLQDDGFEFLTIVHGRSLDGWVWSTLFEPTVDEWQQMITQSQRFAFQVGDSVRLPVIRSGSFRFSNLRSSVPECPLNRAQLCDEAE